MKRSLILGAAASLLLFGSQPVWADVTLGGLNWTFSGADNLTLTTVVPGGNQPQNIQCVICGANQPQQDPLFGYTNFGNAGNLVESRFFSTNVSGGGNAGLDVVGLPYDLAFLQNFVGATLTFSIGIDVNDSNSAQTLNSFFLLNLTTHKVLAAFTTPTEIPSVNNGTGFPDYTLSGFDLTIGTDIHAGDKLLFFERMTNLNDGPDSFFIVPNQVAVPGPIAGAGIPGLIGALSLWGFAWRRRLREMLS